MLPFLAPSIFHLLSDTFAVRQNVCSEKYALAHQLV